MQIYFRQDIRKDRSKGDKFGVSAVVQIVDQGERIQFQSSLGEKSKISPENFKKGKGFKAHDLIDRVKVEFKKIHDENLKLGDPTVKKDLITAIKLANGINPNPVPKEYFTDYFPTFLDQTKLMTNSEGDFGLKASTLKHYKNLNNLITKFEVSKAVETGKQFKLDLTRATKETLDQFKAYLIDENYAQATIVKRFKSLKTVAKNASENGVKVSDIFSSYSIPKQKARSREEIIYLTTEELKKFQDLIFSADYNSLPNYLQNTLRLIIIQNEIGQRVSDLMRLNRSNFKEKDGLFSARLKQEKTGAEVVIPIITPEAVEVIKSGLFRPISEQKYNQYIKELAKRVGIDKMVKGYRRINNRKQSITGPKYQFCSSHTFRRSCLSNYHNLGVTENWLLKISGHTSTQILYKYLGIDPDKNLDSERLREIILKLKNK